MQVVKTLFAAAAMCLVAGTGAAEDIPQPTGDIILTVSGEITNTNSDDAALFDRQMLEAIGLVDVVTATPWHDGRITFSGVPLGDLLELLGAEGETITAVALNDYEVEIPVSDAEDTGVILAMKMNGEDMTVREKGPIFVIYPYDSSNDLNSQTYFSRSAWQVARLVIR